MRIFWITILVSLLSSCAFDKIFLHPYELDESSNFKQYDEDKEDTLFLNFEDKEPVFSMPSAPDYDLGYEIKTHTVVNSNGDSLNAWHIIPEESNGIGIYFLHGNAGNVVYQYKLMTPLVEKGYSVFMIDYSGFGFSQGESTRQNVVQDAYAGMEYFLANPELRGDQSILFGQSLGGHLSYVVAIKYQEQLDAMVTEGAFSCHKDIAGSSFPVVGRFCTREMYSAEDSISSIRIPKLIIHSTEDKVVPFSHGEELFEKAAEPKTFYQIDKPHIRGTIYYTDSIDYKIKNMLK